ncbi:unnamed protein product [Adineta ricciae]|uniref:NAD(P)(+)--arginine ADP-ribosyltransferase n=1 Tax=Adineta ricciae TaxID=249248 RepID=A0A815SCI1_ADIRI|nr:unnamed protein product [Adineta ricciae]
MASAVSSTNQSELHDSDEHLELFSLVWLDANTAVKDNRDTQQKLRAIINHLVKFRDLQRCQQYIEQMTNDKLVVIVSGRLGRELVPVIDKLHQVSSIYVFCMDPKSHEQWASKFTKVKGIVSDLNRLISQIKRDHKIQLVAEGPLSINLFATNSSGELTTRANSEFIFSQILIDCLLRMKPNTMDREELIARCKIEYEGNCIEAAHLREFEQDYSSEKALWWYTRRTFFCKILNAALSRQNIHLMFLLRSYIFDIHRQLQHYQPKCPLRVFGCQLMSSEQLNTLKQWAGQYISVNSFFSATNNSSKALSILINTNISEDFQRVMFDIDADPGRSTKQLFADINGYSHLSAELEVIFTLGSIFRVKNTSHGENQIWTISMTLLDDDEPELKKVHAHIQRENGSGETNLQMFGKILWKIGQIDLAETYYRRAFNELLPDDPLCIIVCEDLAAISSEKGDNDAYTRWHQKALQLKDQSAPSNSANKHRTTSTSDITVNKDHPKEHVNSILGYATEPLLPLLEACRPLIGIIHDLSSYIETALNKTPQVPPDGLTINESAAIRLYTIQWDSPHQSLHVMLNSALESGDRKNVQPYFKYLKLLLTALVKLPCVPPQTVWRGVNKNMSAQFSQNATITWWSFSSCASSTAELETKGSFSKTGERTLVSIEIINGRRIRAHSYSDSQDEIILLPGTQMVVDSRSQPSLDLHIIHLKQIIPNEMNLEPPFKDANIFPKSKKSSWYTKLKVVLK